MRRGDDGHQNTSRINIFTRDEKGDKQQTPDSYAGAMTVIRTSVESTFLPEIKGDKQQTLTLPTLQYLRKLGCIFIPNSCLLAILVRFLLTMAAVALCLSSESSGSVRIYHRFEKYSVVGHRWPFKRHGGWDKSPTLESVCTARLDGGPR